MEDFEKMIKIIKKRLASAAAWIILFLIIAAVIAILSVAGGTIMTFFGFHADSFGSIILFFLLAGIIGFLGEILAKAFPSVLYKRSLLTFGGARIVFVTLDTIFSILSFLAADAQMGSVTASDLALAVLSFLLAVLSLKDFSRELSASEE